MSTELSLKEIKKEWHGTYKAYVIGFVSCLILTGVSFGLVVLEFLTGYALIYSLLTLAIVQAIVQILFFLHVGQEPKPRWESLIFYFMVLVVFIIAVGSLWIMYDLNKRVMADMMPKEMTHD